MILTLSILEKNFNRQLTSKSTKSKKSNRSGRSGKKDDKKSEEKKKADEEDAKSAKSGLKEAGKHTDQDGVTIDKDTIGTKDGSAEPTIKEKGWFTKQNIQNFLHFYFQEKIKNEKIHMIVGQAYLNFLQGLEKPMQLNEMRNMKEPNYTKLRELLRNPENFGDNVLKVFA